MAALMSARLPSSSRLTMPISSVTLHWRMLVTTGNFWLSCQMSGSLMSFGGYISHKRVCWRPLASALGAVDLDLGGMAKKVGLTSGDGWDDADFVAVLQRRVL